MNYGTIKARNTLNVIERKVLDAYFASKKTEKVKSEEKTTKTYSVKSGDDLTKIAKKKGTTVEKIIELNDDITNENKDNIKVGQKIKIETKSTKKKVSFERIYSANLGDEIYVVVETHLLQDKIIGINVLQGVEKGIEEKNKAIHIQHGDKEGIYTKVKVGEYGKDDKTISNKDDFKDKAVFKIKLGYKDSKKQKTYSDTLEKLTDKKTKLFLLIDAHTENDFIPIYNGRNPDKDGEPDKRTTPNYWLDMDDKWFEIGINKCYCGRDLTKEEVKDIIIAMRKSETSVYKGENKEKLFTGTNCDIPKKDKTYKRFTEELNKVFNKYEINTCIRKTHFLAQTYWEADRYRTSKEYASGKGYNPGKHNDAKSMENTESGDGPRYKGRGLMQLTWRKNYRLYFEYFLNNFKTELEANTVKGITKDKLLKRSNKYYEKISDNLFFALDSAGWFWSEGKKANFTSKSYKKKYKDILDKSLNEIADFGDKYTDMISKLVNGGGNGKSERKKYYEELRDNVVKLKKKCVNYDKIKK